MSEPGKPRRSAMARFLDIVERLGNLLPHPVTLFAMICVGILLLSGVAGYFEWQVPDPRPEGCLLYTSPSPRDQRGSRMPSSA